MPTLLHREPATAARGPVARSTWSDALAPSRREAILRDLVPALNQAAQALLPDRLAGIPGLGDRPVRAMDGTHQTESDPSRRCTPQQGGEDHPQGHAWLRCYHLRLGLPEDVRVDTRRRHETRLWWDDNLAPHALTRQRRGLWVVDRAFIAAARGDANNRARQITMIMRMKRHRCVASTAGLPLT